MNRIEKVLITVGYTVENLKLIEECCPGSFIKKYPKVGRKNCDRNCTKCWESEDK